MGHQKMLADAINEMAAAVFVTDKEGYIVWANNAFFMASGYAESEVIGKTPSLLKSGKQGPVFYRDMWDAILSGKSWQGEVVERRKDGTFYLVDESITALRDENGEVSHFVAVHHNISTPKDEQDLNCYLAYHDVLTGLPNRAHFMCMAESSIQASKRDHKYLALLFVDLDRFKPINDTLGHSAGDRLLRAVAERIRNSVRKSDTVARIGGDEFTVVESDLSNKRSASVLARKLVQAVGQPYKINGTTVRIGASIGIAIYPDDGEDLETLLSKADAAMYRAKKLGGKNYCRLPDH